MRKSRPVSDGLVALLGEGLDLLRSRELAHAIVTIAAERAHRAHRIKKLAGERPEALS